MTYKNSHIHFIGIGGIGMSALAYIARKRGYTVTGCDASIDAPMLDELRTLSCTIDHHHDPSHVQSCDMVVYSTAINKSHPEIAAAIARGIPLLHRSDMLRLLMQGQQCIAITGAHGKTTTTAMVAHILLEADLDPSFVVGGITKNTGRNAHAGSSSWFVTEADESDRSFLNLAATIGVITNVDREHLDTYKDLADIQSACAQFMAQTSATEQVILCHDDPHSAMLIEQFDYKPTTYGVHPQAHVRALDINLHDTYSTFTCALENQTFAVTLHAPGTYNILNALAAIAVAQKVGIAHSIIQQALATFAGVNRRFDLKGKFQDAFVYDDYGHHPTEITNILRVARARAPKKLHVAFQPQRYSRTHALWDDFVTTLAQSPSDHLFLVDIYAAGEQEIEHIDSKRLVQEIAAVNPQLTIEYVESFDALRNRMQHIAATDDVILTLGAGKLHIFAEELVK